MNSHALLNKIFTSSSLSFVNAKKINILVICAGMFPSYTSLLKNLTSISPELTDVNFILIEPNKKKTDLFLQAASSFIFSVHTSFTIYNQSLEHYCREHISERFDIIYFEHPDMRTISILWEKIRGFSFRAAIPSLVNLLKEPGLVIASCISTHECQQLKSLLAYSFSAKPIAIHLSTKPAFTGFNRGLCCPIETRPSEISVQKRIQAIKKSDSAFCIVFLLCILLIVMAPASFIHELCATFVVWPLLLFHRPGLAGWLLQGFILMTIIFILFFF